MNSLKEDKMQGPVRTVIKNFFEKKLAILGLVIFVSIFSICFIFPVFYPLDYFSQDPTQTNMAPGFNLMSVPKKLDSSALHIDAGSSFGVGVDKNGGAYLWGNLSSKLKTVPKNMGKLVHVSAGLDHVVALNENGKVFTWGNDRFNLGKVPSAANKAKIIQADAGYQISVALDDTGKLYVWGNQNIMTITPRPVQGNVQKFVLNTTTALVITKDKQVVSLTTKETPFNSVPQEIQGSVIDLATTDFAAAAITDDKRVTVWGRSDYGIYDVPERIQGHAEQIVAGRGHFTVLLDDGTVESWGWNNYRQSDSPKLSNVVSVSADYYQNYAIDANGKVYKWGLSGYIMGTDQWGRDVFTRLISGGRITMTVGAVAVFISTVIGVIIGGFSGYYGGKLDNFLMRFAEIVNALPFLPIAIILCSIIGNSVSETGRIVMIMVVLGVLSWPGLSRLTRAQILSVRESEFVTAARAMGIKEISIIFKHVFPNVISVILVSVTLSLATAMIIESTLSFIGFGVMEPSPTWGNMLNSCLDSKTIGVYWWRWVFPAIALSLSTISINIIGEALNDAIDPKSNER